MARIHEDVEAMKDTVMSAAEVQIGLSFVEDNGHWSDKSGSYAVDGVYEQMAGDTYYHSAGDRTPVLLLSIPESAVIQRVQILQRWQTKNEGPYSYSFTEK